MKQIERDGPVALLRAVLNGPPATGRSSGRIKTNREAQVIRLIALGHSNKAIADTLQISIKTVEKHRGNAMQRFGLRNTADITRFAVAAKLIQIKPFKL